MSALGRKEYNKLFWLASFYYLSHILFDFFPGPVAILWPLTDIGYGIWVGVLVSQQSVFPTFWPYFTLITEQAKTSNEIAGVSIATSQSIAVAALFLAIVFLKPIRKRINKSRI